MLTMKKCFQLMIIFCFLSVTSSFNYLSAEDTSKESIADVQQMKETQENAPVQNYPQIKMDSTRYDAGDVDEGDVFSHDFIVKNTGTAQLDISKVKAG